MAFGARVLLLEGESANENREGALSGLLQIAGGAVFRGLPRLCASFVNRQVRAPNSGAIPIYPKGFIFYTDIDPLGCIHFVCLLKYECEFSCAVEYPLCTPIIW